MDITFNGNCYFGETHCQCCTKIVPRVKSWVCIQRRNKTKNLNIKKKLNKIKMNNHRVKDYSATYSKEICFKTQIPNLYSN